MEPNYRSVSLGELFNKLKTIFFKNRLAYILYLLGLGVYNFSSMRLFEQTGSLLINLICSILGGCFLLGFTTFAYISDNFEGEISINSFFLPFQKLGGVVTFIVLQYIYVIIALVLVFLIIFGAYSDDLSSIDFNNIEAVKLILMDGIGLFISLFLLLLVLPYLMFNLAPHHFVLSEDGLVQSLLVSFEVFKKNWRTYLLIILILTLSIMFLGFLFGALAEINERIFAVLGLSLLIFGFSFLMLIPYALLSLAMETNDSDLIDDFGQA